MAYPKPAPDHILIEQTPSGLRRWCAARRRAGETVGLVPTMGALHEGHLALITALHAAVDRVVVSIFVNPTQFALGEDFTRYPRTEAEDLAKLQGLGVDVAYMPTPDVMYPTGFATEIAVNGPLTQGLDAIARPGHFTGVATVVGKLLLQAMPDVAAFGEKDYQQLQIIRRMARDLDLGVEILPVKTVRDAHGLALSSRNAYLTDDERQVARQLNKILAKTAKALRAGTPGPEACAEAAQSLLEIGFSSVDYVAFADSDTLKPLAQFEGAGRLLAAARVGNTRLIDNIAVGNIETEL
ncbi:MAG: pantothenate synthetase [Rhodospirillales bacterium]|nr:pantothenate synthetase [Rhodospirillales bacterium]